MKTRRSFAFSFYLLLGLSTLSCNYRSEKNATPETVSSFISFSDVQKTLFKPTCMNCHSTRFPHFSTYTEVKAALSQIERTVLVEHSMPKDGSLSGLQLATLQKWIELGAPENAVAPAPGPTSTSPSAVTWAAVNSAFVSVSCASCHYAHNPEGRTNLTDVKTFKASIGTIMYVSLVEKESPMPPANLPPLTDDQKRVLTEWVIAGQPEE